MGGSDYRFFLIHSVRIGKMLIFTPLFQCTGVLTLSERMHQRRRVTYHYHRSCNYDYESARLEFRKAGVSERCWPYPSPTSRCSLLGSLEKLDTIQGYVTMVEQKDLPSPGIPAYSGQPLLRRGSIDIGTFQGSVGIKACEIDDITIILYGRR